VLSHNRSFYTELSASAFSAKYYTGKEENNNFCSHFTLLFQMLLSKNGWKVIFKKYLSVFALNCILQTVAASLRTDSCTAKTLMFEAFYDLGCQAPY